MRLLLLLLVVAVLLGLAAVAVGAVLTSGPRTRPALPAAAWRAAHVSRDGRTHVVVQRRALATGEALEERPVGVVDEDDPAYDGLFVTRMAEARARAELLNGQDDQDR